MAGWGVVYRAVRADDEYNKEVAIKVAAFGLLTPGWRQRFLRERQILANLDHSNIARLLDGGTTPDGAPFVVMEFVAGKPIDAYCIQNSLARRERIGLMIEVARAVDYAHRHLVVHRDLKPDNILVTQRGAPKLLDFGIAKALDPEGADTDGGKTIDACRLMTPDYASPEQVQGGGHHYRNRRLSTWRAPLFAVGGQTGLPGNQRKHGGAGAGDLRNSSAESRPRR